MTELSTIILCAAVVALVVFLFIYNKKNTAKKNDLINTIASSLIETLTDYIAKNGKKEAKEFDDLADYVIYVKDYLFKKFEEMLAESETIPEKMKKIFSDDMVNSIVDDIITNNMELLEKTFEDSKKKPRTRKKKTGAVPEEAK